MLSLALSLRASSEISKITLAASSHCQALLIQTDYQQTLQDTANTDRLPAAIARHSQYLQTTSCSHCQVMSILTVYQQPLPGTNTSSHCQYRQTTISHCQSIVNTERIPAAIARHGQYRQTTISHCQPLPIQRECQQTLLGTTIQTEYQQSLPILTDHQQSLPGTTITERLPEENANTDRLPEEKC